VNSAYASRCIDHSVPLIVVLLLLAAVPTIGETLLTQDAPNQTWISKAKQSKKAKKAKKSKSSKHKHHSQLLSDPAALA